MHVVRGAVAVGAVVQPAALRTREPHRLNQRVGRYAHQAMARSRVGRVRVLVEDPDLAEGLDERAAEQARQTLIAPVASIPRGPWHPPYLNPGDVGFPGVGGARAA